MAASKINKATAKKTEAEIVFSGKVNEMQDFHLRNRKEGGLSGAVLKSQRIRVLKGNTGKAFLVKFSNGHEAVATRRPSGTIKSRGGKYTKHSAALRTWASPSIPIMTGGERVYGQLEEESRNIVLEEIEKVMAKILNQGTDR